MKRGHVAVLVVAGSAWVAPGWAQDRHVHHASDPASELHLPPGTAPIEIGFEIDNRHVVIPVSVQGGPALPLILDTGMPTSGVLLYTSPQVEALDLPYVPMQAAVGGVGGGRPVEAKVAEGVTLGIGDVRITGDRALVVPRPAHFGGTAAGIIGAALFENFAVEIDPVASRIRLHRPGTFAPSPGFTSVPLEVKGRVPYTSATVVLRGGREVPVQLVVDTGATHPLSLDVDSIEGLAIPAGAIEAEIGRGFVGRLSGHVGRIAALRLADAEVRDVIVTFPDSNRVPGLDARNGNLGNGILRRFQTVFDYAGGRLWLRPTERTREPFDWDMSGLLLDPSGDEGLRVGKVMAGSPAAEAGLKEGDLITGLDGARVGSRDYGRVVERLRKPGTRVKLETLRGDKAQVVVVVLRRLV